MKSKRTLLGRTGGVGLRKIIRVGHSSPAVCIPTDFLKSHGLRIGDEVGLIWNGNLRLFPVSESKAIGQTEEQ